MLCVLCVSEVSQLFERSMTFGETIILRLQFSKLVLEYHLIW